jgi:beta-galactosidase
LGEGRTYYLATDPDKQFLERFYDNILQEYGITPALNAPKGVEITIRHKNGEAIVFVLNHNASSASVELGTRMFRDLLSDEPVVRRITLEGYDVRILREQVHVAESISD